jgi:outer membrane receptor protein involved in Fe transport
VISAEEIMLRAKTVVAQAVDGEAGVHLQRTSPGMAGIFVRGLTGNKVNVFVDGVRYSNGAQRGGVNTFLDLIDPSLLDGIEVLRGTSSAQYGSDALGGSVQFLSKMPALGARGASRWGGSMTLGAETAHRGGYGAGTIENTRSRFGVLGTFTGRKTGDYRPGRGVDTHAAVTRFFGLSSDRFMGSRMPHTGFRQRAGPVRMDWSPTSDGHVVGSYMSSRQVGANRWDQFLGGDGNLIAELNGLQLDFGYVRLESLRAGCFDHASAAYSFNMQREERVNQGGQGDPNANIVHQPERTTVHGVQVNASRRLTSGQTFRVGGDAYFESHDSDSFDIDPNTGARTKIRPRVPDGATYTQGGVFAQTDVEVNSKLTVVGALRAGINQYTAQASDAPIVNGRPMWPDDGLRTASVTGRLGATVAPATAWVVTAAISTGYRAPHMTDLGTLGLTGSGFEVAAPDVAGLRGEIGTTADGSALSTGRPVEQLEPETSVNYDVATRVQTRRLRVGIGVFVNTIDRNIQKQALILPPGAVGTLLGGQPITSQNANGAVFVALSTVPVLVRANFDRARIWGIESDGDVTVAAAVTAGWTYTYLEAADTRTKLPPNIEGGTPAAGGSVWLRWMPKGGRWWVQPYTAFAGEQTKLSSLDAGDRRTGAGRTRGQIQNFFHRGARVRGWISPGLDGTFGTADDKLVQTGETLVQIQDRVLGVGVASAPLWTAVPSYALVGVRFGVRVGPHALVVDGENLTDASYHGISWGMDGPGRGLSVRYTVTFR